MLLDTEKYSDKYLKLKEILEKVYFSRSVVRSSRCRIQEFSTLLEPPRRRLPDPRNSPRRERTFLNVWKGDNSFQGLYCTVLFFFFFLFYPQNDLRNFTRTLKLQGFKNTRILIWRTKFSHNFTREIKFIKFIMKITQ